MITHKISHHFCVDLRWNRQNRPILTILKSHLTCLRFSAHPFRYEVPYKLPYAAGDGIYFGLITDQEKDVSFFLDEMGLTAAQLVHLFRP